MVKLGIRIASLACGLFCLAGTDVSGMSAHDVTTFSIVACDMTTGELGVAVASKFFAVGSVVPWAEAEVGAVATQAFANTTFGPRGLAMMREGQSPDQAINELIGSDDRPRRRQVGMVDAQGRSMTYTGDSCLAWAGGRRGPGYAVQGNILAGEAVVAAMESAYLQTTGTLADRLYAALLAAEANGGDSRGKQSAAMLIVKKGAGYGGYTDRAIDIRVDDHAEPFVELGRLLQFAQMNYAWNEAWTLFTEQRFADALAPMERAARLAPEYGEVHYDLACIRLAGGDRAGALSALQRAVELNPKLAATARTDGDLSGLHGAAEFDVITLDQK